MNLRVDLHIVGSLLAIVGLFQLVAVAAAGIYGEPVLPYAASSVLSFLCGAALNAATRTRDWSIHPRDGFLVVCLGWAAVSIIGALPYVFTGTLGPVDALFESVSGFTTTGSTVLSGLDGLPHALLLWRAFSQWVGGMGIILFTIAILPLLGIGGMQLFKAEVPGPIADKIRPRLTDTARRLWMIYVGLTLTEAVFLFAAGMGPFEAICHALTTLPTGGFSTRDLSVGGFESPLIEWIITFFMLIAGVNFVLHYRLLTGRVKEVWNDAELRYFLGVVGVAVLLITLRLIYDGQIFSDALRLAAFQVVSILTTTGYATANFELWASVTHLIFIVLMILGGMSGSTGGGVKSLRTLIGLRSLLVSFDRLTHPRLVRSVKYGGRPVDEAVVAAIWAFFTAYFLIAAIAAGVITAFDYDLTTAFSAAISAIGNVGPGLGEVGAYDNFAHFPDPVKLLLCGCMLAGRLEVFTLIVLLVPTFWRR